MRSPAGHEGPLSPAEAREIARAIKPRFSEFASRYDTKKYWPEVYQKVRGAFARSNGVSPSILSEGLYWKYGHLGKSRIPPAHKALIAQIQRGWRLTAAGLPGAPEKTFAALYDRFGGKTRFITVAFLAHLMHPRRIPIVDQHNFRAVNALMLAVRTTWRPKRKPTGYEDILLVSCFMRGVLAAWRRRDPSSVPSARELDKFLMMYGKAIKVRLSQNRSRFQRS